MLKNFFQLILILCGTALVIFVGYILLLICAVGGFDKDYSVSELKVKFEENKAAIYELKHYFNRVAPKNTFIEIEFQNDNSLNRFGFAVYDPITDSLIGAEFLEWDLKINTKRTDSLIRRLGWTRATLKTLKEKLDNANCIHIQSGEPSKIGFRRSGMGMYFFNVFDAPIQDGLTAIYNDSCTYILINDRLALEYAGGAIGQQCFYNME